MHPARVPGALVCLGAVLGLAGSVPFYWFEPALWAAVCFAFVLLFGLLMIGGGLRSHTLATASLCSALLGGLFSLWVIWVLGSPFAFGVLAVLRGAAGVVGMTIPLIGSGIQVDPARVPGALVCLGAVLGLAGSVPFYWSGPGLIAALCFAVVLLLGLLMVGGWHRSHSLATASLCFAFLGGMSILWVMWFRGPRTVAGNLIVLTGIEGVVGMTVSLIGTGLGRMTEAEVAGTKLINLDRLSALLICIGGAAGLVGSGVALASIFAFFTAGCFALVLLLGVALLQTMPGGRLLAAVTLYFAIAGNATNFLFMPLFASYGVDSLWSILLQPVAAVIAGAGAIVQLIRSRA